MAKLNCRFTLINSYLVAMKIQPLNKEKHALKTITYDKKVKFILKAISIF